MLVAINLPPTVEFNKVHSEAAGQQLSPGMHLHFLLPIIMALDWTKFGEGASGVAVDSVVCMMA